MPPPADPKVIFLGGIFLILLLAALYITAEIVWPLILAFALSLVLNPLLRAGTELGRYLDAWQSTPLGLIGRLDNASSGRLLLCCFVFGNF
jgi:predicted PurR-regulated permease PerM